MTPEQTARLDALLGHEHERAAPRPVHVLYVVDDQGGTTSTWLTEADAIRHAEVGAVPVRLTIAAYPVPAGESPVLRAEELEPVGAWDPRR